MSSKINTLLFDLDGTILDSKKAIVDVFYTLCQTYGKEKLNYQEVEKQFGTSFRSILAGVAQEKKKKMIGEYFRLLLEEEEKSARLFPGVREVISRLKSEGYRLAVVTNKEKLLVMKNLKKYEMAEFFAGIVTIDDVQNPKPHAEPVERALKLLGSEKAGALMIGDSIFDVKAARNAGVRVAVLDWYHNYSSNEALPDFLFDNIEDIYKLIHSFSPCEVM